MVIPLVLGKILNQPVQSFLLTLKRRNACIEIEIFADLRTVFSPEAKVTNIKMRYIPVIALELKVLCELL